MADTYNGWTNRETWQVALWLANDGEYVGQESRKAAVRGATVLRDYVEEYIHIEMYCGLVGDLIGAALGAVDWSELAESLAEGIGECDTCGAEYDTGDRSDRCGDCGDCADCCEHV